MIGFNKIILSRKGYDSAAGGGYSLYDRETLRYIVSPIPESNEDAEFSNPLKTFVSRMTIYHLMLTILKH